MLSDSEYTVFMCIFILFIFGVISVSYVTVILAVTLIKYACNLEANNFEKPSKWRK